jgi:hypothetical protein
VAGLLPFAPALFEALGLEPIDVKRIARAPDGPPSTAGPATGAVC